MFLPLEAVKTPHLISETPADTITLEILPLSDLTCVRVSTALTNEVIVQG